jgi:hypothetical protein
MAGFSQRLAIPGTYWGNKLRAGDNRFMTDSIKDDRLVGARRISEFRGEDVRRTYYLLERGIIPASREGRMYVASKRALREQHERGTRPRDQG